MNKWKLGKRFIATATICLIAYGLVTVSVTWPIVISAVLAICLTVYGLGHDLQAHK